MCLNGVTYNFLSVWLLPSFHYPSTHRDTTNFNVQKPSLTEAGIKEAASHLSFYCALHLLRGSVPVEGFVLHTPLTRAILSTAIPLQFCFQISEKKTICTVQDDKEQRTHLSVE